MSLLNSTNKFQIDSQTGIWVIGDVHGEYNKLIQLVEKIPSNAKICFVGDLIDRGKDSSKVVEYVMGNKHKCTLGNHEIMMIKAGDDENNNLRWQRYGGRQTLQSYQYFNDETWFKHIDFFKSLPYFLYFEIDGHKPLVVSHSYIHHVWQGKEHNFTEKDGKDILWRHMYEKDLFNTHREYQNDIFNIFGHSPVKEPVITSTYVMIDTGAVYENEEGFGKLSAIHYPSLKVVSIK